jgi:protein-arginine kinase activator protein McsA
LYPANWNVISQRIRERAGNKCEVCGVKNHRYITRSENGWQYSSEGAWNDYKNGFSKTKVVKVILTVAHLNHNPADCRDENLKAMCQQCHLRYDAKLHAGNAAITRKAKKQTALLANGQGQLALE